MDAKVSLVFGGLGSYITYNRKIIPRLYEGPDQVQVFLVALVPVLVLVLVNNCGGEGRGNKLETREKSSLRAEL